jgi:hypothetical protein
MNAYRASIAVAVLAAFAAGIALGTFLNGNPASADEVSSRSPQSKTIPGQSPFQAPRDNAGLTQFPSAASDAVSGSGVVLRLWSALSHPDENTRRIEWLSLMPSLTAADAREVREHFRKMKAQGRSFPFEQNAFWERWGELDGAAAVEQARELGNSVDLVDMAFRGWSKLNPDAARAWITANGGSPLREPAMRGYIEGLARRDLARATQDALALGRDFDTISNVLVEQALLQGNANGMLDWWHTLPAGESGSAARRSAINPILSRLEEISPERAQMWLTELANSPDRDDEELASFAGRLASKDPASAVAWVTSLPTGENGRYPGIGRTTKAWASKDKAGFEKWLADLPPSPLREQVVSAQQPRNSTAQILLNNSSGDFQLLMESFEGVRVKSPSNVKFGIQLQQATENVPPPPPR